MACIFKRKGRKKGPWEYKYKDAKGVWRYGVGWLDKEKTRQHALNLEAECRVIFKGERNAPTAWMQKRNTPILDVIKAFLDWGNSQGGRLHRGWDEQNALLTKKYLEKWVSQLGLVTLADIDLECVEKVIRQELTEGFAPKSVLLKVQALKGLINWSLNHCYLNENPLRGLARLDSKAQNPHRKMLDAEVAALLNTAPLQHRLWYETGLETGFRVNELRLLRVRDLDLFGPSLTQPPEFAKDRKEHRQPITRTLANKLTALTVGKGLDASLLNIPTSKASKIFKNDCVKAGIPLEVKEQVGGKTITRQTTWHSLRKVYISNLFKSGLDLKTIQTLGRLSSAELAVEVYAVSDPALLRSGVEAAAQRVQEAISASACCTRVAKKVAGAEGPIVTSSTAKTLPHLKMVGDTGLEPVTPCL